MVSPKPDLPSPIAAYLAASCGLSPAAALRASRRFRIRSIARADAVLALLRRYGFSGAHISKLVRRRPQLLALNPRTILQPKLDFLAGVGFAGPSLPRLLSATPALLGHSLEKKLAPSVDFLRGILGADAYIAVAAARIPRALGTDVDMVMRPAVEALRRHGLPEEAISQLVLIQPAVLLLSPCRIGQIVRTLRAAGLRATDRQFLRGFRTLCHLNSSSWKGKIRFYKSFGFSKRDVLTAFRSQPSIVMLSDEKIEKKLRFFLDKVKLNLADIVAHPLVLAVSLEHTVVPRCAVLSVLTRVGKIAEDVDRVGPLVASAQRFWNKFVSKYQHDVPDALRAYMGEIKFRGF